VVLGQGKIMKVKKVAVLLIIFVLQTFVVFAEKVESKVKIGILNGPSCIPICKLIDSKKNNSEYEYEKYADPQSLLPKLLKNEIDICFLPLNVAAKVYNSSNKKIKCLAITGTGNLSLITKDEKLKTLSQLKGKIVNIAGQGATPEYIFRFLLEENNISYNLDFNFEDKKDSVLFDFSIPTANIVPSLIANKIEYAIVPEPFATIACTKDKSIKTVIDIQREFEKTTEKENKFPLTVMVSTKDFCSKNKEKVQSFLNDYKKSYEWTIKNPLQAGKLCEKHELGLAADIVEKSIPKANYTFMSAKKGKQSCQELLKIFLKSEPSSIGAKLPDSDFYY